MTGQSPHCLFLSKSTKPVRDDPEQECRQKVWHFRQTKHKGLSATEQCYTTKTQWKHGFFSSATHRLKAASNVQQRLHLLKNHENSKVTTENTEFSNCCPQMFNLTKIPKQLLRKMSQNINHIHWKAKYLFCKLRHVSGKISMYMS